MDTGKAVFRFGAAVLLAAAFFAWDTMREEEHVPAKLRAEPDLFSFVKPMPGAMADMPLAAGPAQSVEKPLPGEASAPDLLVHTEQAVRQARARGASEDDIYRLRAAGLSAATATQLADMEREEAAWQARIGAYFVERDRLLANASAVPADELLHQLRDARFSAAEQQRLTAFEDAGLTQ